MSGAKRPIIYRFIEGVLKDVDIARAKIFAFEKAKRDVAAKNAVLTYLQRKRKWSRSYTAQIKVILEVGVLVLYLGKRSSIRRKTIL